MPLVGRARAPSLLGEVTHSRVRRNSTNTYDSKLPSKWLGPYTVTKVFPHGAVEVEKDSGEIFKVKGKRLKPYYENAHVGLIEEIKVENILDGSWGTLPFVFCAFEGVVFDWYGVSWVLPSPGVLKFNVDSLVFGSSGKTGCGGVLWDDKGRIFAIFSGPLGRIDYNEAEVQAINHAL
ncbi:hypothetical protein GQ457_05G016590 [Hibiscus cannabinus]